MNPVHGGVGVVVVGAKCDVVVVAVLIGGEDNKHKVPLKKKYVAIIVFCS